MTNHQASSRRERFRGRYEVKLDPKGRLSLPTAFRQQLAENSLVVTNARYQDRSCLHVYSESEWQKLEDKISNLSTLKPEVQAFTRFYLAGGQLVETDSQTRILIPQSLRRFAGLDTQVVLVGMGSKFEIWSQDNWNSIYEQLTVSFEETMSAVADLESDSNHAHEVSSTPKAKRGSK